METTMNDREVFEAVLEKVKRNGIEIKRPYNEYVHPNLYWW